MAAHEEARPEFNASKRVFAPIGRFKGLSTSCILLGSLIKLADSEDWLASHVKSFGIQKSSGFFGGHVPIGCHSLSEKATVLAHPACGID